MLKRILCMGLFVGGLVHCSGGENGGPSGPGGQGGGAGGSSASAGGNGGMNAGGGGMGGDGGILFPSGSGGGGGSCMPTSAVETTCDGKDDDCNGRVDDVDVGKDGICDCLRLGIVGGPGSNPSSNFQAWLTERGTSVERTHQTPGEVFDAAFLDKYDVLIFDRLTRPYTAEEASALAAWVGMRGGFVAMTGYTDAEPDFYTNTLLAPFGLAYQPGLYSEPVTMFAAHPVTAGLSSVTFLGGYLVKDLGGSGGTSAAIGSISAGPVAFAHERGKGRAVVWGDEWIEYDSEWQALPEIEQLWVNILAWIGPQDSCQVTVPK
ncbi:ThuA domain-containing protein [Polyangium sorediatum]|uniref:Uncharacterized protein n=1 Tax=Polyangium sorediatum TaxID=889274 RepID=A0ABT6P887_9BACT|nr:ThuA domain-containing protein [Polyangium sorediatum]MDI1436844.1 hypothetical protein [Polyangium sorediatum]